MAPIRERERQYTAGLELRRCEAFAPDTIRAGEQGGSTIAEYRKGFLSETGDRPSQDSPIHFDGWLGRRLPQRAPRWFGKVGRFYREHGAMNDKVAQPYLRFDKR